MRISDWSSDVCSRALSLSNAVFSQIISMSSNTHGPASVNRQIHASNIFRLVRGQKKRAVGNVDRVTELSPGDLACLLLQHVRGDVRRDRRVPYAGPDRLHPNAAVHHITPT